MITVREDICRGCAICTRACPRGAIRIESRKARIDPVRCDECMQCVRACPMGAIVSVEEDSYAETAKALMDLQRRVRELSERVAALERG